MTWRCEGCGKISNAKAAPRSHRRPGNLQCGPFVAAVVAPDGAVIAPAGAVIEAAASAPARPDVYRQSLLKSFEVCPRRALHDIQLPDDLSVGNVGSSGDLGSATHAVFRRILETMRKNGEAQIPTQEGIEIMYEVVAGGDWVLPASDFDDLIRFTLSFCTYYKWPRPAMALEERLTLDLVCPDGVMRTLTGQPDVIVADPPDGLVIVDYKTGRGKPRDPRQMPEKGEAIVGKEYLSDTGTFQLKIYGLLALHRYPAAQRVTLREAWIRFGERREAVLGRDELEHVEREVALKMMLLDRAIDDGPHGKLARPRAGKQCLKGCPVKRSCPIPAEQRGLGALDSPQTADAEAARFVVVDALRQEQRDALKAYHEQTGHAPEVGDGTVMRWRPKASGKGRDFGVFDPEVIDVEARERADAEVVEAMRVQAELNRRERVPVA